MTDEYKDGYKRGFFDAIISVQRMINELKPADIYKTREDLAFEELMRRRLEQQIAFDISESARQVAESEDRE